MHLKIRPYDFFNIFTDAHTYFQGNEQQDAHEFLRILLDSLHEDMNRQEGLRVSKTITLENPSNETEKTSSKKHWEDIQGSIGSVISDLCGGQTRNKISCNHCDSSMVIFEMLMDISLPISIPKAEFQFEIIFISRIQNFCIKYKFHFKANFELNELLDKFLRITETNLEEVFFYVKKGKLLKQIKPKSLLKYANNELYAFEIISTIEEIELFGKKTLKSLYNPNWRENIEKNDLLDVNIDGRWIVGHVLKQSRDIIEVMLERGMGEIVKIDRESHILAAYRAFTSHNSKILHILIYHQRLIYMNYELFGIPVLLSIGNWYSLKELRNTLENLCIHLTSLTKTIGFFKYTILKRDLSCALCNQSTCKGCEIPRTFEYLDTLPPGIIIIITWESYVLYKPRIKEIEEMEDIDIYTCLEEFTKEETIEFNCKKCGNNQSTSKTDICRLPDVLIIHLKRFRFEGSSPLKINNKVEFPLIGLDLSSLLMENKKIYELTQSNSKDNNLYDLFAVVNHSGNVYGGHYTCSCLGDIQGEKKWLYYDDDHVYELQGNAQQEIVSSKAYILLYKKQRFSSSNVINYY